MGMTIEEIIQELESTKGYPANDPASDEALDGAIDIMRKYQKIEQIAREGKNETRCEEIVRIIDGNVN